MLTKLTDLDTKRSVYVDLDRAIAIRPLERSDDYPGITDRTRIDLHGGTVLLVTETPDQIVAMARPATEPLPTSR